MLLNLGMGGGMIMGMMGQGSGKGMHGSEMMDPKSRGKVMQDRLDMMQMMMEHMMGRCRLPRQRSRRAALLPRKE
jgi:hypothetical protein